MNLQLLKVPTHEKVYQHLREMVLFGELAPGQAVTIQGFADMMNAGITPVREAIRRLTAEGALVFQGNRRVCVPELTLSQLEEVAYLRMTVEPRLAYLACSHVTDENIAQLKKLDEALDVAIEQGDTRGYQECNYRFHQALSSIANAPILLETANALWMRMGPSLRVVRGRSGTSNLPDMHREAVVALQERDGEAAAHAIERDVEQGVEQIRNSLTSKI